MADNRTDSCNPENQGHQSESKLRHTRPTRGKHGAQADLVTFSASFVADKHCPGAPPHVRHQELRNGPAPVGVDIKQANKQTSPRGPVRLVATDASRAAGPDTAR